ncbi:MAG TPA: hypothetical protein ENF52_07135, partial [Chloroflexi bacterium]|nr:hypothetical protein [Chloroflexota bacterium]
HPDFPSGTFAPGSDTGSDAHGTHVAGIIAARNSGSVDISGVYDCQGMAPSATLYVVDLDSNTYIEAFNRFRDNGIVASNHSWGFTYDPYSYDSRTETIDGYADNEDFTIVVAAGNDGPGSGTITNPATGKNVITVGAVRYVTDDDTPGRELGGVAEYSSRGPAQGRLKPDLVAPGGQTWFDYWYYKYGVVSLDEFPSGNTDDEAWPESSNYVRMSGTSMAAPHVTGTIGLMLDQANVHGYEIDNESIKAMLIATTIPLDDGGSSPASGYASTDVGYGLVNAFNATRWYYVGESEELLWGGGSLSYWDTEDEWEFYVPSGVKRLMVVLSYDDQEGGGGELIDDLDLELDDGVACYYYFLPPGVSEESPIEKIIVENPRTGVNWKARVRFVNPGILSSQDYCIYVYALYKLPQLSITSVSYPTEVSPGEDFSVSVTVENTGGWIAAGVTVRVIASGFGGQAGWTKYVGNLMYEGSSATATFHLTAPDSPGTYDLIVNVDGINRSISSVSTSKRITVVGNPALCKSTSSLDFGTSATTKTFEVWNCGGGTLSYTISDDRTWISVSPTSGSSTGEHDTITVTVNRSGLSPGHYTGTVTIDPNYGANQTVTVSMDVVNNPPNTPTNLSPCGVTNVSLTPTLQASAFSDPDGDSFANSQWQVDDSSSFPSPVWDSGTYSPVTSVTVPSGVLNYSTTYWWRVRYKDGRGSWSDWSSPCSFTTKACTPPSVPQNVSASDGTYSNMVRVTWNAVSGATRYEVYRAVEKCGTYVKVGESTTTTYDDTNVDACRIYWYTARACNACGCSSDSVPDSGYAGSPAPGSSAVFRVERGTGNVYTDGSYYGQCYYSGS